MKKGSWDRQEQKHDKKSQVKPGLEKRKLLLH